MHVPLGGVWGGVENGKEYVCESKRKVKIHVKFRLSMVRRMLEHHYLAGSKW